MGRANPYSCHPPLPEMGQVILYDDFKKQ